MRGGTSLWTSSCRKTFKHSSHINALQRTQMHNTGTQTASLPSLVRHVSFFPFPFLPSNYPPWDKGPSEAMTHWEKSPPESESSEAVARKIHYYHCKTVWWMRSHRETFCWQNKIKFKTKSTKTPTTTKPPQIRKALIKQKNNWQKIQKPFN